MSHCHGSKISGSPQSVVLQIWQKKNQGYDFSLHCCTQEQDSSSYFSSIEKAMAVSVKKDC